MDIAGLVRMKLLKRGTEGKVAEAMGTRSPQARYNLIGCLAVPTYMRDSEAIDDPGSYAEMVEGLAKASRGQFKPSDVRDLVDWKGEQAGLWFTLGGKEYRADLAWIGDWTDYGSVFGIINKALEENGSKMRVYEVDTEDQCYCAVFLTEEERKALGEVAVLRDHWRFVGSIRFMHRGKEVERPLEWPQDPHQLRVCLSMEYVPKGAGIYRVSLWEPHISLATLTPEEMESAAKVYKITPAV
jgi:hypothetical protein